MVEENLKEDLASWANRDPSVMTAVGFHPFLLIDIDYNYVPWDSSCTPNLIKKLVKLLHQELVANFIDFSGDAIWIRCFTVFHEW